MMSTNKKELSTSWSIEEFTGLDLGDARLNKRLLSVADALAAHPTATINAACGDWAIEVYFKILKSGTKVEEVRFQTQERLLRFIALLSVIAWRLYWLTIINRQAPDTDCTHILTEVEWKALYCITHKTHILPKKLPTVSEVVVWIAKLGGFLGRKSDGKPGVTVIWRGWQRLSDISDTFALFHQYTQNNIGQNLIDGHVP